jgi:hypothetical protein
MDRGSAKAVIAVTYFLGCMCLLTQGLMDFGSAALAVLIFISGMCINGAQNGLQAYSPAYYQTEIAPPALAGCTVLAVAERYLALPSVA